jgi:hypothetical protein
LIRKVLTAMLVLLSGSARAEELPLNPDVTKATLATTICQAGWTRTIRPFVSTMKQIKAEMLAAAGEPIERRNQYELDHKIPLALGGRGQGGALAAATGGGSGGSAQNGGTAGAGGLGAAGGAVIIEHF